jgi:ribosomal protein S18 acetylase RimI-like enzyme
MKFELDEALIDDILFHMENQDGDFVFDSQTGNIIDIFCDEPDEKSDLYEGRFIALPQWDSQDGYRLMEKFVSALKNPVLRQELSCALNRSKGVFRAFKSVLEQYPETEKMWFSHKEQQMKNEVIVWYNSLREEWGLEPVGIEPDDNSSLILEDFVFTDNGEFSITAETADGEPAGFINAAINGSSIHINNLETRIEYRGMGLGKTLLAKLLEKADKQKLDVSIDLPANMDFFSRTLLLEEFKPSMQRFLRKK